MQRGICFYPSKYLLHAKNTIYTAVLSSRMLGFFLQKAGYCPHVVGCNFITNILDLDSLYHIPNQYIAHATKFVPCVGQMDWKANAYLRLKENTLFNITFVKFSDSIELETREKFVCYSVPLKLGRHFASKQRPSEETTVFTLTSSRTIEYSSSETEKRTIV